MTCLRLSLLNVAAGDAAAAAAAAAAFFPEWDPRHRKASKRLRQRRAEGDEEEDHIFSLSLCYSMSKRSRLQYVNRNKGVISNPWQFNRLLKGKAVNLFETKISTQPIPYNYST